MKQYNNRDDIKAYLTDDEYNAETVDAGGTIFRINAELEAYVHEHKMRLGKIKKKSMDEFVHILSTIDDYRIKSRCKYRLENLLGICFVMSLMQKMKSISYVADYVRINLRKFIKLRLIEKGKYPSHDTFRRMFMLMDANDLKDTFIRMVKQFYDKFELRCVPDRGKKKTIYNFDGQEVNSSGRADGCQGSMRNKNVLNIYSVGSALSLSTKVIDDKTNEIPVAQDFLRRMNLTDCIVTADALHCQTDTVRLIKARGGDYAIKVKKNQPELHAKVIGEFENLKEAKPVEFNGNFYYVYRIKGTKYAEWEGACSLVKMKSFKHYRQDKTKDKETTRYQYFMTSLSDRDEIIETIDLRWQIENGLHKFKDEVLKQDRQRITDKKAIKCMNVMNNVIYALFRAVSAVTAIPQNELKIKCEETPEYVFEVMGKLFTKQNWIAEIDGKMRGRKPKSPAR